MSINENLIDGKWQSGTSKIIITYDPSTGQEQWRAKSASMQQIEAAKHAAHRALPAWRVSSIDERIKILKAYQALLEKNQANLALLISQETGKPLWEAQSEVRSMVSKIDISIQAYQERTPEKSFIQSSSHYQLSHAAQGIFIVLGPFNMPGHLPNGHIVPALLAGNTILFKPSEYTPQTGLMLVKLLQEAGIPDGVVNVLIGDKDAAEAMLNLKDIAGILFTGSYKTGKYIHERTAGLVDKLLVLEMGGNNPLLIWETEEFKAACYYTLISAFITTGQRCTCARRLIIQDQLADKFLEMFIHMTKNLKIGAYQKPEVFMGPQTSIAQATAILDVEKHLSVLGGKVLLPMQLLQENTGFVSPGLIDVTNTTVPDEEYFSPLLQIIRVKDFSSAIEQANNTRYGLAAGLLTQNLDLLPIFKNTIKAGVLAINKELTGASSQLPFGGIGCSGNFRPSAYYAADYCAYPVAASWQEHLSLPQALLPGISLC